MKCDTMDKSECVDGKLGQILKFILMYSGFLYVLLLYFLGLQLLISSTAFSTSLFFSLLLLLKRPVALRSSALR